MLAQVVEPPKSSPRDRVQNQPVEMLLNEFANVVAATGQVTVVKSTGTQDEVKHRSFGLDV